MVERLSFVRFEDSKKFTTSTSTSSNPSNSARGFRLIDTLPGWRRASEDTSSVTASSAAWTPVEQTMTHSATTAVGSVGSGASTPPVTATVSTAAVLAAAAERAGELREFDVDCISLRAVNLGFRQHTRFQSVEEVGGLVRFRSQPFVCEVLLQLDRSLATSDWTLGLVQGCSRSSFTAQFEDACRLESCCQPLVSGTFRMLNDGDGVQFPFVTHGNALFEIDKNTVVADQCQLLSYNCVFTPYTQIDVVLTSRRHYLTHASFRHTCTTWLVAVRRGDLTERHHHQRVKYLTFNPTWDRLYSLMTMRWDCSFQAELDYRRGGGDTVVTFNESGADSPCICERPLPIFRSVLLGPALPDTRATLCYLGNGSQPAQLRQPPKYITVPWGIWQRQMQRSNSGLLMYGCQQDWEPRAWPIQQPNSLIGRQPEVVVRTFD